MNWQILVAIVAALSAPLFAYLAAARKLSGKIQTSEASSLWAEASNLRKEYKEEVTRLRAELDECLDRIAAVEDINRKLRIENGGMTRTIKDQKLRIEELEASVAILTGDNRRLKQENDDLKARVVQLEKNGNP